MSFTTKRRLKRLLEAYADRKGGRRKRLRAAGILARKYPVGRSTDLYGLILREEPLSDAARWMVMLMLFYVGNDAAVRGLSAFIRDPAMAPELKGSAIMLLFGLNAREAVSASEAARFPLPWLRQAERIMSAPVSERVRRELVIEELLFDHLRPTEGNDP